MPEQAGIKVGCTAGTQELILVQKREQFFSPAVSLIFLVMAVTEQSDNVGKGAFAISLVADNRYEFLVQVDLFVFEPYPVPAVIGGRMADPEGSQVPPRVFPYADFDLRLLSDEHPVRRLEDDLLEAFKS